MSKVKLIWVTPSAEELITYIARVSNPQNQLKQTEADTPTKDKMVSNLIAFMLRESHVSPFEMVDVCFEVNTTRAISAQMIRHRSFFFQEFSQRYADVSKLGKKPVEIRYKGTSNRQSSLQPEEAGVSSIQHKLFSSLATWALNVSYFIYSFLLRMGVANESARGILPISAPTRLYMKGNLRSWIFYLKSRTEEHTQKEHREIALEIESKLREIFPLTFKGYDQFINSSD